MSTSRQQRYLTPGSADGRKDRGLKRSTLALLSILGLFVLAAASLPASAATRAGSSPRAASDSSKGYDEPFCQSSRTTCADDSGSSGVSTSGTTSRRYCSSPAARARATT